MFGLTVAVSGNIQREGCPVALLESTGSKGSVLVNGVLVKKNTNCVLNSGDEVVFGLLGNHCYVSFCLLQLFFPSLFVFRLIESVILLI